MLFWIAVAVMSVAVTWAVTRPLMRDSGALDPTADADVAIYKDQLAEIDSDEARGTISAADAEQARTEIARRLLRKTSAPHIAAKQPRSADTPAAGSRIVTGTYLALTFALPVLGLAIYLVLGSPGVPDQPLAARLNEMPTSAPANDLVARVEARLREHPEDGQGWNVIAPVYFAMGRFADAASAYASAMRLIGETPDRLMGFANARIRVENGLIPEDAKMALERVISIAPERREPRVWLAVAKEQDGKRDAAVADYRALLADAPSDAAWKQFVEGRLAGLEGKPAPQPSSDAAAPPPLDSAAIEAMAPEQRQQVINQMVERLAKRLADNGQDAKGWMMLIRSYQMLGRTADAEKAVADARRVLEGNAAALAEVNGLAKELGLGG